MASTEEKPAPPPEPEKVAQLPDAPGPEREKAAQPAEAPPPEAKAPAGPSPPPDYFLLVDVILRVLLFALSVVAVVVLVTSKQTKLVVLSITPFTAVFQTAKFNHSPAFIYFVVAFSVAGLYSIITALGSIFAILKPGSSTKLLAHVVIFDVLLLGIVAAATGAAGAVGYIGWKGNSYTRWDKVCNVFDVFCKHVAASLAASLFASVVLTLLVILSLYSLSKKIPK